MAGRLVLEAETVWKSDGTYISYGLFVSIEDYIKRWDEFRNFIDGNCLEEQAEIYLKLLNN